MALYSNRELLGIMTGGNNEEREALLNQPTDIQTASNALTRGATGLYSNIDNLTGNLADLLSQKDNVNIIDRFKNIQSNKDLGEMQKALQSGKAYFDKPTTKGGISQLLQLSGQDIGGMINDGRIEAELKHKEYQQKQELARQYSTGGLGEAIGEMILTTPIMKYGNMSKTTEALKSSVNGLNTAKAIAIDSVKNAGTLSTSELLLGKLYGKSDDEAIVNAVTAGAIGLLGTPLVGGAMVGGNKLLKAESKFQAEQAGGGVPTKEQQVELDKNIDIAYQEPASPYTQEIKARLDEITRTKSGREISGVEEGKKQIESIEYDVVEPKATTTKPIEEQTYVPEVNNPKKFKYGYDERGRVYNEESSALGPQGGATQKATLQQREKPKIDNPVDEVNRRLEFFDNDAKLRERYGQTQAIYKETKELSESQQNANRLHFEKQQYKDIIKSETGEVKKLARQKLDELNKVKIEDYIVSPKQLSEAEKVFEKQTKVPDTKNTKIEKELSEDYQAYKSIQQKTNKKGFQPDVSTRPSNEVISNVIKSAKSGLLGAKKAIREIKKKESLNGKEFNPENITDTQRRMYRDDVAKIEDVQGSMRDLNLLRENKIEIDEFRYRARRRLDDKLSRDSKSEFKTKSEADLYKKDIIKQYDDIGVYVEEKNITLKSKDKSEFTEPEDKKIKRETKELSDSKLKHNTTVTSLQKYKETGKLERFKSGPRKGQKILSDSQIKDIDDGVLSIEEVANKTSPIGILEDIKELKVKAKEEANLKTTLETRKQLGIKDNFLAKTIKFKDTLLDASNSVAQITTVLLGSKRLAKLSKLYGGETDIRSIVGDKMNGLLPKDFPIIANKDTVKPLFMTENYGQGSKGLIRNIMKANKVDKETATKFFNAYEKAFDEISPEMVTLRNTIYSTMKNNPTGEFKWKLPDGVEVSFKLQKKLDGTYSIKGKNNDIKVDTNSINEFSRALMPNVIHSVDAYVAREMNKLGIATVHDAFQTPVGMTDKFVQDAYGEIMAKVNDSNLLDDILKDLGYEGPSLKVGDLESSKIKESSTKSAILPEEVKGMEVEAVVRELDVSKPNTPEEVMKEYMASGNVREEHFNKLVSTMTNEAGYRTMSVAREGDDVFERQVALAHQSSTYNPKNAIETPEGVNKEVWNKVQEQIFNEARARLEYNPLLNDVINGERKTFNKDGKYIGSNEKTLQEIIKEVKARDIELSTKLNAETKRLKQEKVKYEPEIEIAIKEATKTADELGIQSGTFKQTIENWKTGFKSDGVYGQINKLNNLTRKSLDKSAQTGQVVKNTISKLYEAHGIKKDSSFDFQFQSHILDTDYISLKTNKKESMKFLRDNKSLYEKMKSVIDQSAKGMKNKGEMNHPDYYPNATLIAKKFGLPFEQIEVVDKLISIKSMSDANWKFIESNNNSELFKEMMSIVETSKKQTLELFQNDTAKSMKGYRLETYDSLYKMQDGKKVLDVGGGAEQGALPVNLMSKKVGERDIRKKAKDETNEQMYDYALTKGLGLVFDRSANPMAFRKVATEIERNALGRRISAMDTLANTIESNTRKLLQSDGVINEAVRMLDEGNDLFSRNIQEGFVTLTNAEKRTLPKELQDIEYVNPDFKHMLLGNKEIEVFKDGMLSVIEQVYKDGFIHFKQNVVLKNPASWLNNYMFGMVMNVNAGLSPKQAFTYSKAGPAIYSEMQKLTEDLIELDIKGMIDSPRALKVKSQLESNEIYQMVQSGMAVSVMADIIKTSSKSHLFTDRVVGKGLRKVIGDKATDLLANAYFHQSSKTGRIANGMFTRIDVMHRYALTKHALDNGATMDEAVAKSNGVYGNLDLISPMWSQAIQAYGAVPFSNWFFRVSGGLQDTSRKNIARTIALSAGLYGISELSGKRTEGWNPLMTLINTPIDFIEMSPLTSPIGTVKNIAVPKVYSKIATGIDTGEFTDIAVTDRFR